MSRFLYAIDTERVSCASDILSDNEDEDGPSFDKTILHQMETINLGYNRLYDLPEDLHLFVKLKHLKLNNNFIKELDGELLLKTCPNLVGLDISLNLISNITNLYPLAHMKKLEVLDISKNPLQLNDNRIAMIQHFLFLPNFKPRITPKAPSSPSKNFFITHYEASPSSPSSPNYMRGTANSTRRFGLDSPTGSKGSPTTLNNNWSLDKLRNQISFQDRRSLSPSHPRVSPVGIPRKSAREKREEREKEPILRFDSDDDDPAPTTPTNSRVLYCEKEIDDMVFKNKKTKDNNIIKNVPSVCNMLPFSASVRNLKSKIPSGISKSYNVPRDLTTPFPSLSILNGVKITVDEYLLAENEEVFDICTRTGTNNRFQHDDDVDKKEELDSNEVASNTKKKKKKKEEMKLSNYVGSNENLQSDVLHHKLKEGRRRIDAILGVKRSSKIDFRPFKHQIQDLNKEEIELKLRRLELNENIKYWNNVIQDSFEHSVNSAAPPDMVPDTPIIKEKRRPASASTRKAPASRITAKQRRDLNMKDPNRFQEDDSDIAEYLQNNLKRRSSKSISLNTSRTNTSEKDQTNDGDIISDLHSKDNEIALKGSKKTRRRQMAINQEKITLNGQEFKFHSLFV
ncbi:leucine-rich repeat (LRR) protein [Acrasis kona]|uniref:Leucine-rich repeat (LRR) protein n=1 Tax=Acrasis kona TaxID=1008807 RepID=A0AAW2ZPV0_9EUKA